MKKIVHIVGKKNSGKTTLIVELISYFTKNGIKVGSVKHSSHFHEIDREGKDSYRHRKAGAVPAAFITLEGLGIYISREAITDPYLLLEPLYKSCQIVLVEGDIDRKGAKKVEVWRPEVNSPPLAMERDDITAVITDTPPEELPPHLHVWPRREIPALAQKIIEL